MRDILRGIGRGVQAVVMPPARLAFTVVASASAFISYTHISALTLNEGGNWKTAHLMPLCLDGMIVAGSAYFMDGRNKRQKAAGLLIGVLPGTGGSLIANWESGIAHGYWAAGWSTVPALSFAFTMLLFERWLANRRLARREAGELRTEHEAEIAALRVQLAAQARRSPPRRQPAAPGAAPQGQGQPAPAPAPAAAGARLELPSGAALRALLEGPLSSRQVEELYEENGQKVGRFRVNSMRKALREGRPGPWDEEEATEDAA